MVAMGTTEAMGNNTVDLLVPPTRLAPLSNMYSPEAPS